MFEYNQTTKLSWVNLTDWLVSSAEVSFMTPQSGVVPSLLIVDWYVLIIGIDQVTNQSQSRNSTDRLTAW